jgi:hypothetical protein
MKVLIVATHWQNNPALLLRRGFKDAGHDVKTFGPYTTGYWYPDYKYTNNGDVEYRGEWQFEFDLIVNTDHFFFLSNSMCKNVLVAQDSLAFSPEIYSYRQLTQFDAEFYVDSRDALPRANGYFLPCAYDPQLHRPGPTWEERPLEVALYGQIDDRRAEVIHEIEKDRQVAIGLGDINLYELGMHNTKIALCQSRCGNLDQRVFEGMAMGCLVLSDAKWDMHKLSFMPNMHYLEYHTPIEARMLVTQALTYPATSKRIIENGLKFVQPHTWQARAETIIKTLWR